VAMKAGHWSGIVGHGNAYEDFVVQESMGPIVDRTNEHLGTSDQAVIRFRRLMIEAARRGSDETPVGLHDGIDLSGLRGIDQTVPLEREWQSLTPVPSA